MKDKKQEIQQLLQELRNCLTIEAQPRIRAKLRKLGHWKGLDGEKVRERVVKFEISLAQPKYSDTKLTNLSELYYALHNGMLLEKIFTLLPLTLFRVNWKPWGVWKYIDYKDTKLKMLENSYVSRRRLEIANNQFQTAYKKGNAESIIFNFKQSNSTHTYGPCLSLINFRIAHDGSIYPLIYWRTIEITRRGLADFILIHNLLQDVADSYYNNIKFVDLSIGIIKIFKYMIPLICVWMPYLKKIAPLVKIMRDSNYLAAKRINKLAISSCAMFENQSGLAKLTFKALKNDFPRYSILHQKKGVRTFRKI